MARRTSKVVEDTNAVPDALKPNTEALKPALDTSTPPDDTIEVAPAEPMAPSDVAKFDANPAKGGADLVMHNMNQPPPTNDQDAKLRDLKEAEKNFIVAQAAARRVSMDGKVVPGVVKPGDLAVASKAQRFVVTKGGSMVQGGMRTLIRPGKIVDAVNFDLKMLDVCGIEYKPFAP
jgi:hypothetical protein